MDWSKAKSGYNYVFAKNINGLAVDVKWDATAQNTPKEIYAPPFQVESISVCVTEDGVVAFYWENMSKQTEVIAENTKLFPFAEIQEHLFDYLFYGIGAPSGIPTKFRFDVKGVDLRYTYVEAYKNPDRAWLVHAWFFTARAYVDDSKGSGLQNENGTQSVMINALDGGNIKFFYKE